MTDYAGERDTMQPGVGLVLDENGHTADLGSLVRKLEKAMLPMGGLQVSEYTPFFEVLPEKVSLFTDRTFTSGGATISVQDGEYKLSRSGGETCRLETAQRGPYQPGLIGLPGIGSRRTTVPSGTTVYRQGFFNASNGFGIGEDANGLHTFTRSGGTTTKQRERGDWLDPLDGTGPSGHSLDILDGRIHRFPFGYYGYSGVEFGIVISPGGSQPDEYVPIDRFVPSQGLEWSNITLPVSAEITGDSAGELFVTGRQYGVIGRLNLKRRIIGEKRDTLALDAANGFVPALSARLPTSGIGINALIQIAGIGLFPDVNLEWYVGLGGETDSSTWADTQFAVNDPGAPEFQTDATAFTTDPEILAGPDFVASGGGANLSGASLNLPDQDVPIGEPVHIAVKPFSGTGNLTRSSLRMAERR